MILHGLEQIETLKGRELWDVMRKAYNAKMVTVIKACAERAKELNNREYGNWEEVKNKLDNQKFPDWEIKTKNESARLMGYLCHVIQEVGETEKIKNQHMVIVNPFTNSCYTKWFIQNGEVLFQ